MEHPLQTGQVFLINKPLGWTSFDVVNRLRAHIRHTTGLKKIKVGHAGTLDPLATGLLIICTGRFTKKIETFQELEKEYSGTFFLGMTTPSFDLEKEPDTTYPTKHLSPELLHDVAIRLTGKQLQIPPRFSARKLDGKRLYEYARKQREVIVEPREIEIREFELTRIDLPEADFRVVCSKGTYIRALARDFGEAAGTGAYLLSLCRTRIGNFSLQDAMSPQEWISAQIM